jgi:hypothetical protein
MTVSTTKAVLLALQLDDTESPNLRATRACTAARASVYADT